jgi:hypothetical protein
MKPVKILLLLLILSLSFSSTFSQENEFKLSDFKLPDLERKTLDAYLDLGGGNYFIKIPEGFSYFSEERQNNYLGNIRMDYSHFLNNAEYQRETFLNVNLAAYSRSFKYVLNPDEYYKEKIKSFSPAISYLRSNRKYYKPGNFFETNLYLGYQFQVIKDKEEFRGFFDATNEFNPLIHTLSAVVPIKIGIGRIEQVQDARHAIYLYEELAKIERITTNQSGEDIVEFANLIAKIKNKRFFDSRIKRMRELETIDSFLLASGQLLDSDVRYFTTLADYWDFGGRPVRNSGFRISFGLYPGYYFYHFKIKDNVLTYDRKKINLNAFQINGGIEFKYEKPLNLYWQNSIEIIANGGFMQGKITDGTYIDFDDEYFETKNTLSVPNIQLGFFHGIGFYPNTRTEMTLKSSLQYVRLFDKTSIGDEIYGVDGKGLKPAVNLLFNYYISPQLRLNIFATFYYIWQKSSDGAIINFDQMTGGTQLNGILPTYPYSYYSVYRDKELMNSFKISFVYSFI